MLEEKHGSVEVRLESECEKMSSNNSKLGTVI